MFERSENTMNGHLGIEFVSVALDRIEATMPVDHRTHQPFGLLHGGASVVLAETVASTGAWVNIDEEQYSAVGMEINANHLRPVFSGHVRAVGCPIQMGKRSHVWEVKIESSEGKLICISRCTIAIIEKVEAA
jgi:1,4-dihydroxy-2-naphthoyl-CoA hydrolase